MQFDAQRRDYAGRYPDGRHYIVSVDRCDVGRLWVGEDQRDLVVLDIALLPEHRNQGIGASLYARMIDPARASGKTLRASVSAANSGSLRFHERMGFTAAGRDEMDISFVRC